MLFSIPKLDDSKRRQGKTIYFLTFFGHDQSTDLMKFELVFGWAPDLMHPQLDRGKPVPAMLAMQWVWRGKTLRDMGLPLCLSFKYRSDIKFIWERMLARRLANADV